MIDLKGLGYDLKQLSKEEVKSFIEVMLRFYNDYQIIIEVKQNE